MLSTPRLTSLAVIMSATTLVPGAAAPPSSGGDLSPSAPLWTSPGLNPVDLTKPGVLVRLKPGAELKRTDSGMIQFKNASGELLDTDISASSVRPLLRPGVGQDAALLAELGLDRAWVVTPHELTGRGLLCDQLMAWDSVVEFAAPEGVSAPVPVSDPITDEETDALSAALMYEHSIGDEEGPGGGPDDLEADPDFTLQWGLENTGQVIDGVPGQPGADIGAIDAWSSLADPSPVTIAVIDVGVSPSHQDLASVVVNGANFSNADIDDWYPDFNAHGTHVAGIIAAVRENGIGIAGVCPSASIMPIRSFNDLFIGFESQVINGIIWATDNGADVISMSFGFDPSSIDMPLLRSGVIYGFRKDKVLVAAAGNSPDVPVRLPAAYSEVIAVGSTDNRDALWQNSTTGPAIELTAPGWRIWSTVDTPFAPNSFGYDSGTSAATPMVAGVAAMLKSVDPELTSHEIRTILQSTAKDLGRQGRDHNFGYGRLDAGRAIGSITRVVHVPYGEMGCWADLNSDGEINIRDILIYLTWFAAQEDRADIAPPLGEISFPDIVEFLGRFMSPCGQPVEMDG